MESIPGENNSPYCFIKQLGGLRSGRCLDTHSQRVEPGGQLQVFPCVKKWQQMFGFGDDLIAPKGSIYTSIPTNVFQTILHKGKDQAQHLCIGKRAITIKCNRLIWNQSASNPILKISHGALM